MRVERSEIGRPHRRRTPRRGAAALVAALGASALLTAAPSASANGRFPAAGLIGVHPRDPAQLLVRATYGILVSRDRGATFHWICEGAVGFGGYEDPMVSFASDGTLLAGVFKGLSASTNGGCDWTFAENLADRYVTDLSVERADPSKAVLVVSSGVDDRTFLTQLWASSDNGRSWTQAGVDLPDDFLALTVDVAPSDPARVYVSGRFSVRDDAGEVHYFGALQRTLDRGGTWERFSIPDSDDTRLPYLSAIDPDDPDVMYVRVDGDTDTLLVSKDGGQTFTTAYQGQGDLPGFALSPDGTTVLVGGKADGVVRAPASTLSFEKVSDVGVQCLTWAASGLFACGDEFVDSFTVAVSEDEGRTFSPLLHLDGLCGPLTCDDGSSFPEVCGDLWGPTQLTIGSRDCAPTSPPEPPGPAEDGGSGSCACRLDARSAAGGALGTALAIGGMMAAAGRRFARRQRR